MSDNEELKRMIRLGRRMKEANEAIQRAQREVEAEDAAAAEAGKDNSDSMTSKEALRRMLEEGCRQVRGTGEYPSKERVRLVLNKMSRSTLWRLWVQVREEGEEWPPG